MTKELYIKQNDRTKRGNETDAAVFTCQRTYVMLLYGPNGSRNLARSLRPKRH